MRTLVPVALALLYGCKGTETYTSKLGSDEVFVEPTPGVPPTDDMVRVPAANDGTSKEFFIDRYEVTAAQYGHCEELRQCDATATTGNCDEASGIHIADIHHPVNCVIARDAEAYCKYRRKRLPTQAEWLRAAQGDDKRPFPWGAAQPSCTTAALLIHECAAGKPADVGTHPAGASPFGAQDLVGNVSEIVFVPPVLHGDGGYAVMGGDYATEPRFLVQGLLEQREDSISDPQIGFRCAWSVDMLGNVKRAE